MLPNVVLQLDGQPLKLSVTTIDMPIYLALQSGYGTIRVFTAATLADGLTGTHQIDYTNSYTPAGSSYQVNTFVDKGVAITLGKQNRDSIQQSLTVDYTIASMASAPAVPATTTTTTVAETAPVAALGTAAGGEQLWATCTSRRDRRGCCWWAWRWPLPSVVFMR